MAESKKLLLEEVIEIREHELIEIDGMLVQVIEGRCSDCIFDCDGLEGMCLDAPCTSDLCFGEISE